MLLDRFLDFHRIGPGQPSALHTKFVETVSGLLAELPVLNQGSRHALAAVTLMMDSPALVQGAHHPPSRTGT